MEKVGNPSTKLSTGASETTIRRIQYAVVIGFAIHAIHVIEHVAQVGYWFTSPSDTAWMTPWAIASRDLLTFGGRISTGTVLLHLLANVVFFAALAGLVWLSRAHLIPESRFPHLSKAVSAQGVLLAEHMLLLLTALTIGKPIGVSTLFGFATGSWGTSYAIWFNFILIAIATYYGVMAIAEMHQDDLVMPRRTDTTSSVATAS